VIGMKLSFAEQSWKAQLRELIPAEKSIERIIKKAIRAGARATLQCWEARGGALARRHTAAIDARPRGGGPMATVDKNYTIPSSTDATGPRNPHSPSRNPLTHPHGPNAMCNPPLPQPHPRERLIATAMSKHRGSVTLGISKLYKLTPNSTFTPLLGR